MSATNDGYGGLPRLRSRRIRDLGRVTGLLVASLSLSLGVAELLIRWIAPQQLIRERPDMWQPVDTLGWASRPDVDTHLNTGERTVRWITDSRGFRVASSGPVESHRAVLLLGDSFMAALQVEYEQSFAGLMERGLRDALTAPIAIHNAAVVSWDAPHYLIAARRLVPEESYELVIIAVYLGNDIVPRRVSAYRPRPLTHLRRFRFPRNLTHEEMVESIARPTNDILERRSHLFVLLKKKLEVTRMRLGLSARYIPWGIQLTNAQSEAWDVTADILADIAELGNTHQVPILFILIPSHYQVDLQTLEDHARAMGYDPDRLDPLQPNRLLRGRLEDRGLRIFDALPAFQAAHEEGTPLYGKRDPHFAPAGHRVLWEAVKEDVVRLLRWTPQGPDIL